MATTLAGKRPYNQLVNRGLEFIQDTYSSSQDEFMPNNESILLSRGIVIEANFNRDVYGVGGVIRPPYSLNIRIVGNDFNTTDPTRVDEERWYAPFFPIHNVSIPEIGEEVLVINESQDYSSKGFWIGRVNESALTNLFLAESWKDSSISEGSEFEPTSEEKYGFSFDVKSLRENPVVDKVSPSFTAENIAIRATYGDVIQQGRSRTYVRHSFNKNNYIGLLEQGINNNFDTTNDEVGFQPLSGSNPSLGETRTKTIHFVDTSVKRVGDFNFASSKREIEFGQLNSSVKRSMIFNEADQIFNVAGGNDGFNTTLYSQVLGEKLNSYHRKNVKVMQSMLDGITGLTMTVQTLLNAFVEHEHALPKIELDLEKTVTSEDTFIQPAVFRRQPPQIISVPDKTIRVMVGSKPSRNAAYGAAPEAVYKDIKIPGFTKEVARPPKQIVPARRRVRTREQTINFEAIIGGAENPRFTAPIEISKVASQPNIPAGIGPQERAMLIAQGRGSVQFTDLGIKTNNVNNDTEDLIDAFNAQKEQLNMIFSRVTEYLSENQFVN
jgi:hypothetical protein